MEKPATENKHGDKSELIFVAIEKRIMHGSRCVAIAASVTMARRIARALNLYKPNERGY